MKGFPLDSNEFVTQEKARDLVTLLERSRELLSRNPSAYGSSSEDWHQSRDALLKDIHETID